MKSLPLNYFRRWYSNGTEKSINTAASTPTLNHTLKYADAAASTKSHSARPTHSALFSSGSWRLKAIPPINSSVALHPTIMAPYKALSHGMRTSLGNGSTLSPKMIKKTPNSNAMVETVKNHIFIFRFCTFASFILQALRASSPVPFGPGYFLDSISRPLGWLFQSRCDRSDSDRPLRAKNKFRPIPVPVPKIF